VTTSAMDWRTQVPAFVRQHRKQLGAAAAVLVLLVLVLIDHSGAPPIVDEATTTGVAAPTVALSATGDKRVHAQPGTLHVGVDAAKLLTVTVTLTSTADQPLVVTGDARLLATGTGLVEGFASGGTVLPAHGSAVLQLSGTPPFAAVGSVTLDLQATAQQPPG